MTQESTGNGWPEDPADGELDGWEKPGVPRLMALYGAPFLLLLLFPVLAWIGLLPAALILRRTSPPAHRRRLVWTYAITGLISFAPWIPMVARGPG
jgi:hypothetical protein